MLKYGLIKKIFFSFLNIIFVFSVIFSMEVDPSTIFSPKDHSLEYLEKYKKQQSFKEILKLVRNGDLAQLQLYPLEIIKADFNTFEFDENGNTFIFYVFSILAMQKDNYYFEHLTLDQTKKEQIVLCLKYLIEKYNLNLRKKNKDSWSAMHAAASCGAIEFMDILFELDPSLLEIKHDRGKTPLLIAANVGCFESMDFLLKKSANFRAVDSRGWNIFHVFAMTNQYGCCKQILDNASKDPEDLDFVFELLQQKDKQQRLPADVAFEYGNVDLGNYLLQFSN